MKIFKSFSFGDIILIDYPFSDLTQTKKRPALVLKEDQEDILIVFISSQPLKESASDFEMLKDTFNNLVVDSTLRISKINVLHKKLVYKKIGHTSNEQKEKIKRHLLTFFESL